MTSVVEVNAHKISILRFPVSTPTTVTEKKSKTIPLTGRGSP
jgi:hypothetical protein